MKFEGLDELIKECTKLATGKDLEKVDREIVKEGSLIGHKEAEKRIHKSIDPSKSGRKGSRTGQHGRDNIPITSIKKKNDRVFIVVGWEKSDDSPYFYMKMEEWGTSHRSAHPAFLPAAEVTYKELKKIGMRKYENLLKELLG
jgi:HK97 gp10 family phage protein